jgi:hypothetical protein
MKSNLGSLPPPASTRRQEFGFCEICLMPACFSEQGGSRKRRQRLSICRSIIEAHNRRLWASPNVPRGAIFCFTAPAHPAAASNIVGDGVECAEADNSTHVPPSGYSFVGTVVPLAGDAESSGENCAYQYIDV